PGPSATGASWPSRPGAASSRRASAFGCRSRIGRTGPPSPPERWWCTCSGGATRTWRASSAPRRVTTSTSSRRSSGRRGPTGVRCSPDATGSPARSSIASTPPTTSGSSSPPTEDGATDPAARNSASTGSATSRRDTRPRRADQAGRVIMSAMDVDLRLDPFDASWAEVRDGANAVVNAGFAGIWTPDHLDGRVFDADRVLECWTTLTAIAVATSDVIVGPLVLNVANRHPGVLATMAATLQDVSGGRLLLGLGAGGGRDARYEREQTAIGRAVPPDRVRRAQVEACVDEMRRLWTAPGFLQPDPAPPVVIAASGPKMAEIAGRVGDGINVPAAHPALPALVEV